MSQRWRGLNAIGHFTGQHVAVMHPLGILSFIETCTAATLWVGSSATDKLCATLRNPARSHHPVFPRWRRDKCTTCSGCFGAMCTALTCQPDVPVLGREKRQVGLSRLGKDPVYTFTTAVVTLSLSPPLWLLVGSCTDSFTFTTAVVTQVGVSHPIGQLPAL